MSFSLAPPAGFAWAANARVCGRIAHGHAMEGYSRWAYAFGSW